MRISVIIPTLNESENIARATGQLLGVPGVDAVVVDGGSTDNTVEVASLCGVRVLCTPPGRARQMNAGAAVATGDIFLFLHADTLLPEGFAGYVRDCLSKGAVAGAFELAIDSPNPWLRLIERLVNWRSRAFGMPYGDQAIFVRADVFREVGGYPDKPIMEDYELMRRLKKRGRIGIAPARALTSARRWARQGIIKTTLINQMVILGYMLGVPPEELRGWSRR